MQIIIKLLQHIAQNAVDSSCDPPFLCQHFKLKYLEIPVETLIQYLRDFLRPPEIFHLYTRVDRRRDSFNGG